MIQKDHITDERPGRDIIEAQTEFWRTAARAEFDADKWSHIGQLQNLSNKTKATAESKYLPKFEFESPHSYAERLVLANDFGFSKDVIASYSQLCRSAAKTIKITGLPNDLRERFEKNIDGNGTTWEVYFCEAFDELLTVGRIWGATDTFETEVGSGVFAPLSYMIPRESIRNFASGGETFKFVTWDSIEESAVGIKRTDEHVIYIMTDEEIAIARQRKKGEWKVEDLVPLPEKLNYPPVRDAWFGLEPLPIIDIISKLQFNMFNLDSEMRKGMRQQVGTSILEIDAQVDLDTLTDRSIIPRNVNMVSTKFIEPTDSSYQAHFKYGEMLASFIHNLSKLRSQKNSAETALSKQLDFIMVEAVYNAGVDVLVPFIQQQIKDWGNFANVDAEAEIDIDRKLDFAPAQERIDALLKELAVGFGPTVETKLKKQYRDKNLDLTDEELQASDAEIEAEGEGVDDSSLTPNALTDPNAAALTFDN